MSNSEIIIRITRDSEEQVKTTIENNAGEDKVLHIMSGAIKLFLNDDEAMMMYAQLVRSYLESQNKGEK